MSRGARGGPDDARAGESREAARLLGAALYLEDMEDTRISESDPTIGAISAVIAAVRPTMVYTHSIHDVHQDHRNTHRAAMVAARSIGSVYCFQSPSATVDFRPARFIDIEEQIAGKLAAISAYASQAAVRRYLEPDLIEATARYWSRYGASRYAEAFEVVRDHASGPASASTVRAVTDHAPVPAPGRPWRRAMQHHQCREISVLVTGAGGPRHLGAQVAAGRPLRPADRRGHGRLGRGALPGPGRRGR